ncbi:MAG: glycosyltransferase family 2 protein [Candidatus Gastranaerophilales bacterium]|nr:glycosyltransferase family 2 protein [Candidatus Gastranaerophilales bacterium]MCM1072891.1 glycosyltransferase family 2 protein [Bacteroides sp.]
MKLSIITLTYNKLDYTKKFIESLYKYTTDFELIVVDNGSTDGTIEYLKSLSNIKTIFNSENQGFSKGNNQGLEIAQGEFIGFLNNDILLSPDWFKEIEKIFQSQNAAFVSPRQINPYYDKANEKNYLKYFEKQNYTKPYAKDFDECVFSCVITKRSVIDKIGSFDENYSPAFFEDNDLKFRAINSGYDVFVANTCCFFHFGSVTSAGLNYKFSKNKEYFYSKYPFAEYSNTAGENLRILQHKIRVLEKIPGAKIFYKAHLIYEKIKRRLKK